jgi:peptidoglycan-associated lipoprotein
LVCLHSAAANDFKEKNMHRTFRTGLILLLVIPCLAVMSACTKKTTTVKAEPEVQTETADLERQKALEAERQRKEAEQRRFQAAKRQFMLEDIYFKRGSYRLEPQARTILYRKAEFLKKYPQVTAIIEGHTNERGSRETNIAFGDRRAGAVKSFLIKEGIDRDRLIAVSFGKEQPVDSGPSEKARAKNRRVHFVVRE